MFFLKHSTLLRIENLKEYVKNVKKKYLTHELERANLKIVILKSHFLFSQMSFSGQKMKNRARRKEVLKKRDFSIPGQGSRKTVLFFSGPTTMALTQGVIPFELSGHPFFRALKKWFGFFAAKIDGGAGKEEVQIIFFT